MKKRVIERVDNLRSQRTEDEMGKGIVVKGSRMMAKNGVELLEA